VLPQLQLQLLYQGTRDGMQGEAFHNRCDNQGATLTVILLKNGCIFGGYTSISWTGPASATWKDDSKAFVYSLSDGKQPPRPPCKFPINPNSQFPKNAIYDSTDRVQFGYNGAFYLMGNNYASSASCCGYTYALPANTNTVQYAVNNQHANSYLAGSSGGWQFEDVLVYKVV